MSVCLGIYGLEIEKTIVIFEINKLKFAKNEFLTHTVNFDIGSTLSKGLGSTFFEGPGLAPGPICKVCWLIALSPALLSHISSAFSLT